MTHTLYHYRALVTGVYDGDTCTADIDLGPYTWLKSQKLRLHRIDAPEVKGKSARKDAETQRLRKGFLCDPLRSFATLRLCVNIFCFFFARKLLEFYSMFDFLKRPML